MSTRIQNVIDALGIKKAEFARQLNLSQPFVSELCSGAKNPSDRTISDICRIFHVNETWLKSGNGPMFVEKARDQQIKDFVDRAMQGESDNFKRRLLAVLSQLNESEWGVLEAKLREILGGAPAIQEPDIQPIGAKPVSNPERRADDSEPEKMIEFPKKKVRNGMVEIQVFDQPATAGLGNYLEDADHHSENYPDYIIPDGTDFGVIISGDSMEPKIHAGGTAFVQATPVIDEGKIGIFLLNGEAYCKQFRVDPTTQQIHLVSLNPKYPDIVVRLADHFRVLGRVLGQWTRGQEQQHYGW